MKRRRPWFLLLGVLLSGCALTPTTSAMPTPTQGADVDSTASALRAAVDGDFPLEDITIDYAAGIEGWGGLTLVLVHSGGVVDVTFRLVGEATTWSLTLEEDELLDFLRLLVENEVWAVEGEREIGFPDEAYPRVTVTAEGFEAFSVGMWDSEALEHAHYGPIVRALDSLAYRAKTETQEND